MRSKKMCKEDCFNSILEQLKENGVNTVNSNNKVINYAKGNFKVSYIPIALDDLYDWHYRYIGFFTSNATDDIFMELHYESLSTNPYRNSILDVAEQLKNNKSIACLITGTSHKRFVFRLCTPINKVPKDMSFSKYFNECYNSFINSIKAAINKY